ncbi:MAG: hypothetical protein LBD62_05630 [Candidatus Margulisbacteria bacterium]|nr:hypothetical protein [Candidatus Margulisiibacteriota bacterium]
MRRWRYFCLFFLLWAALSANPLDVRRYLKPLLEEQLGALLAKKVAIGELRGNLYNRLILTDVAVSETDGQNMILIGRAELTYSLKNILLQKLDIVSNLRAITVNDAYLLLKRDARDKWNFILPTDGGDKKENNKKTPKPKMRVSLNNISVRYIDEKGWGKKQLLKRYEQRLSGLNGTADIQDGEIVFSAAGTLGQNTGVYLRGQYGQGYALTINARQVDLAEHGFYALSFSDYEVNTGRADIDFRITAQEKAAPVFAAAMNVRDGEFKPGELLAEPLRQINGALSWQDGQIYFDNLQADLLGSPLTLNGAILPGEIPEIDLQGSIRDVDLQKKYSAFTPLDGLSGLAAASFELKGPLSELSGGGRFVVADLGYLQNEIGLVSAEFAMQGGQSEIFFRSPDKMEGSLVFRGGWENLLADLDLKVDGLEINAALHKDISQNIAAVVHSARLDLQKSNFAQLYLPDSAGEAEFIGELFWLDKRLLFNGSLRTGELQYADLVVTPLNGRFLFDGAEFRVADFHFGLADSFLTGNASVKLAAGGQPVWQRLAVSVDIDTSVDLAAAYEFTGKAKAVWQDLQRRLQDPAENQRPLVPARLPDSILYAEYGDSVLSRFKDYLPAAPTADTLPALDLRGQLDGHLAFYSRGADFRIEQDLRIVNGSLQGQSADLIEFTAGTDRSGQVSLNVLLQGLRTADMAGHDSLFLSALISSGNLYFQDFALTQGGRTARQVLTGTFPLFGFWDENFAQDEINLRLRLAGEDFALLVPFFGGTISSPGDVELTLRGTLAAPRLSADKLNLANTRISFDNYYIQEALIRRADLALRDNELTLHNLEIILRSDGRDTSPLRLSGKLGLPGWSFRQVEQLVLPVDLAVEDTQGELNLHGLYSGDFELRDVRLNGELALPISAEKKADFDKRIRANEPLGPLLTGTLSFSNGTLSLLSTDKPLNLKSEKALSVLLDLNLNIKNNLRASSTASLLSGDFSGFLGQINVRLRDNNPPVRISGSTNYLRVNGLIYLDEGYVSFLNRKFTLLEQREQERYFLGATAHRPRENYLEFVETEKYALEPYLSVVAQTTVYDTQAVSNSALTVSGDIDSAEAAPQMITTETDYLVFVDGSVFDLSSITFEKYHKENLEMALDGEPYVLRDKNTGKTIDQYRFQELAYEISPPLMKSALALARGTSTQTGDEVMRETARDLTVTEINLLARTILRPVEKSAAQITGLYDVRFKRDVGIDAVRFAGLETQTALVDTEEAPLTEYWFGLEMVGDLWMERVFFSVDTTLDRNLQTRNLNVTVNSYKLTLKLLKNYFLDELSLNVGQELDSLQEEYIPVLSLEMLLNF